MNEEELQARLMEITKKIIRDKRETGYRYKEDVEEQTKLLKQLNQVEQRN